MEPDLAFAPPESSPVSSSFRPQILVLTGAVLWGTVSVTAKYLYDLGQITPLSLGFLRLAVAAPLLALLSLRLDRGLPWRWRRQDLVWWLMAMVSMGAYQLFIFAAVQRTTVTTAVALAICMSPVLVALAAPVLLGERFRRRTLRAGALAITGTALVLGIGSAGDLFNLNYLLGNLLALGAAASWATYVIVASHLVRDHSVTRITFLTFAGATLLVLPLVLLQSQPVVLPPSGWALVLYIGAVPTALSYYLYVRGLHGTTATTAAFLTLAEPATAALLAALLFGERLTVLGWLGVLLLLIGLMDLNR